MILEAHTHKTTSSCPQKFPERCEANCCFEKLFLTSVEEWQPYSDATKSVVILTRAFETNAPLCLWNYKGMCNYNVLFKNQRIWSAFFWGFTKFYRRFGTTDPSHLQESNGHYKVGPKRRRKRSVTNYYFARRKISDERRSRLPRGGRLKSTNK
jgi:hypothetical protein